MATASSVVGQILQTHAKLTVDILKAGRDQPPFSSGGEGDDPSTAIAEGRFIDASLWKKFW